MNFSLSFLKNRICIDPSGFEFPARITRFASQLIFQVFLQSNRIVVVGVSGAENKRNVPCSRGLQ